MVQVHINGNTMNAARQAAKRKENLEYRDTGTRGLAIRVKSGTCYWWLVTASKKAQLAPMDAFGAEKIELLRSLVPKIKLAWSEGRDASYLIKEVVGGGEHDLEKAEHKAGVRAGEWTWETLRDRYLEAAETTLAADTIRGHRNALGYKPGVVQEDFKALAGMPIKSIKASDIAKVLKSIQDRGKLKAEGKGNNWNQARLTHAVIRAAFKWACDPQVSPDSGISENVSLMVATPPKPKADPKAARAKATFVPLLASPKQLQAFGFNWIWEDDKGHKLVKRALQLQMLTGQRVASVLRAHRIEFVRTPGRPWSYVWALGPDKMGAYRLLPLPDVASFVVQKCLQAERKEESSPFLFPQLKKGKGKERADGHISYSTAKTILMRAAGEGGPLPSSFKGTHDFRRAFTTILSDWSTHGFHDRGSVESVTHANEGRETVSQSIYNYDERLAEKFRVLEKYQDLVLYADRGGKRHEYHDRYWELDYDGDTSEMTAEEMAHLYAHMESEYKPMPGDDEDDD